ncbi:flagellar motor switch protein FliN [Marinospirillum alkaliphilum]|uniref:Flagellar motor switch protein FliN n=1 Tax=Marinospirillum alkaliphilum DSM 21637 TaxID=1122209 RepID=A0A1K1VB28_9GAMM|nr:flagellar motor switch protein FliN [Marinospirillum alkaliphilum]SFX22328.1 flagellar motor switch protein FliN/FliY [Marinospirillum alkaliphilum DSM 21637]
MSEEENNEDWASALDESGTDDDWAAAMNEQGGSASASDDMDDWGAALEEQAKSDGELTEDDIQSAPLEYLEDDSVGFDGDNPNLEVIMDIPVTIAMEVGSTEIAIRNLLQLNQGSVIELDRLAGEPLDVKVNGTLIAHGEVVMVNEKFGIRLTDVVSPSERIKRLR